MCILKVDYYTQCGCKYTRRNSIKSCGPWISKHLIRARERKSAPLRNWWGRVKSTLNVLKYEPCVMIAQDIAISGFCEECKSIGPQFMEARRMQWARDKMRLDHTHPPFHDYVNGYCHPANMYSSSERKSHAWLCSECTAAQLTPHPLEKVNNPYDLCCSWPGALQEWNRYRGFAESPEDSVLNSPVACS